MPSTRVVPPLDPRGLLTLVAVIGALSGWLLTLFFEWLTTNYHYIDTFIAGIVVLAHVVVLPPLLTGLLLARLTQSARRTTKAGLVFGAAQAAGLFGYNFASSQTGGAPASIWTFLAPLIAAAVAAAIGCGVFHLARVLTRSLLFHTIEQTGTLCHRCGYDRATPAIAICPECATPADPTSFRARRFLAVAALARRAARPAAAVLLLLLLVTAANTVITRTIPASRFVRTFRAPDVPITQWQIVPPGWPNWTPGTHAKIALAAWVPFPDGSDRVALVMYAPDRSTPEPAMQIAVAAKPLGSSHYIVPDHGALHIGLNVPRALADRIAREGLPRSLLQAIADSADTRSWQPSPGGGFSMLNIDPEIDPAPHFPPL